MALNHSGPLTVWSNAGFGKPAMDRLREGVSRHTFLTAEVKTASVLQSGPYDPSMAAAEIVFGQPDPEAILRAEKIRWIHLTSAGYARYDHRDFREAIRARGVIITNSSHVYDEPCAQHVFAMMLALSRRLPWALRNQLEDKAWPQAKLRADSFLLKGQTVLLLGFGAIAQRLVELLAPFGFRICALRRQAGAEPGVEIIAESDLDRVLPLADHLLDLLPENEATNRFVNRARLGAMKPGAFFYNIGRGTTVDHPALIAALETGKITAAYLDVTSPEPLPPDDPLWSAPNCFITPHTAGGHRDEEERLVAHFLDNLRAFETGDPMKGEIFSA